MYVYLDTTRGIRNRHGGQNVSGGRAGDRIWNVGVGPLWGGADAAGIKNVPPGKTGGTYVILPGGDDVWWRPCPGRPGER